MKHIKKIRLKKKIQSGLCSDLYFDFYEDKTGKIWIQPFIGRVRGDKCSAGFFIEKWGDDFTFSKIPKELMDKIKIQATAEMI
jgi:hypothetical protein